MKKKVIIEGVPSKSSKKKVVIEGLPKAEVGTGNLSPRMRAKIAATTPLDKTGSSGFDNYMQQQENQNVIWNPLKRPEVSTPEVTGMPNYKQTMGTPEIHGYDFYDPGKGYYDPKQKTSKTRKPSDINFKMGYPNIYPLVGNRYLQESLTAFSNIPKYLSNLGKAPKDISIPAPTYNPYVNMYYGAEGGYLPMYQNAGQLPKFNEYFNKEWENSQEYPEPTIPGEGQQKSPFEGKSFDESMEMLGTGPIATEKSNTVNLNKGSNIYGTIGSIAGAVSQLGTGVTKGIKGFADIAGTNLANRREREMLANLQRQSVYSEGINDRPYETQGYGFTGRNQLAADGMQIRQIGGMGDPNVEVEGDEHIKLPNGFSQEIKGKSHAQGGIPLNLPQGTQIFSEKLKDPETGKSYADLAKKYETKKFVDMLNKKTADPIQKATAEMMIKQNNEKLEQLFALQEQNKRSGVHGEKVQFDALQEDAQSQQQEPKESMMMHGGYHLPKAQAGKDFSKWTGQIFKTPAGIMTPQGVNLNVNPLANWAAFAQKYAPMDERITEKQTPEAIAALQEVIYDDYLDSLEGRDALRKMWQTYGTTNKMEKNYADIAGKIKKGEKLTDDDLNKLRANYIDTFAGKRLPEYLQPIKTTTTATTTKQEESKKDETGAPTPPTQIVKKTYEVPGMNLGIALPNVYERLPLNYYQIEPDYIDPRYLDIQPQLNRLQRGQRAFETALGSRGSSDIANLLQSQANRAAAEQEAFGQKYNYDRAQDAAAQQFNAQAKQATDQYNQQSWYQQLEDPIRRRESLIGTQQMMNEQAAIENARKMQAFYGNKEFIGDTFYPAQNMTLQDLLGTLGAGNFFKQYQANAVKESKTSKDDEEKTEVKRYGGKVKKKVKIKMKLKK